MSSDIRAWLNGNRDFAVGVQIYRLQGTDAALLNRLQQDETASLKKALFFALKSLLQPNVSNTDKPEVIKITKQLVYNSTENPASIEAKREADRIYKTMMNKRAELLAICPLEESPLDTHPDEKKKRAVLARDIIVLNRQVDAAYDDYRYALQYGVAREKEAPVADSIDPLFLPQAISNLRKRLSKLRNGEQTERALQLIQEKELLLTQYQEQYERAKTAGPVAAE